MRTKPTLLIAALTALFGGVAAADTMATATMDKCAAATSIHFKFDSSALPPLASQTLCTTVKTAKANPTKLVVLDGHADKIGASDYNVGLSLRRAEAVRDKLVAMGVDRDRIVISTFGEDGKSLGSNQEDRRVSIRLTDEAVASVIDQTFAQKGTSVTWEKPMTTAQLEVPMRDQVATR